MLKITKFRLLFCVAAMLFSSNLITAQVSTPDPKELLKKIDHSIENLHTVVYKMYHKNKFLSRRDTITTTAVCSLYVNGNKMFNIVDEVSTELGASTYGFRKYDGKKCLWMNWKTDSLDVTNKPDVISKKHKVEAVVENYKSLLLSQYIMQKQPFGKYEAMARTLALRKRSLTMFLYMYSPLSLRIMKISGIMWKSITYGSQIIFPWRIPHSYDGKTWNNTFITS